MNGYAFHFKSISIGYHFTQKVYEYVKCENYIWIGTIFPIVSIWMGHIFHLAYYMNRVGSGDSSRTSVPKIKASYPLPWQFAYICKMCTGWMPLTFLDYAMSKCLTLRGRPIFVEKTDDTKWSFLFLSWKRYIAQICDYVHMPKITLGSKFSICANFTHTE